MTRPLSAPFLFRTSVKLARLSCDPAVVTPFYPSGYHICLSSPKQPSWAVCWFSQEFVTCLIEHLSQIWALWCNILTLSDVRNSCRHRACLVLDPSAVDDPDWVQIPIAFFLCNIFFFVQYFFLVRKPCGPVVVCHFQICQLYFHLRTAAMLETDSSE